MVVTKVCLSMCGCILAIRRAIGGRKVREQRVVFDRSVLNDWRPEPQMPDDDSVAIGRLLDRLERLPSSDLWAEIEGLSCLPTCPDPQVKAGSRSGQI